MTFLVLLALALLALSLWAANSARSARKSVEHLEEDLRAARHLERVVARLEAAMELLSERVRLLDHRGPVISSISTHDPVPPRHHEKRTASVFPPQTITPTRSRSRGT